MLPKRKFKSGHDKRVLKTKREQETKKLKGSLLPFLCLNKNSTLTTIQENGYYF